MFAAAGIAAAAFALGTVVTTGMIYASLKPVAQWHSPYTVPGYLIFSIMTGAVILTALLRLFGAESRLVALLALADDRDRLGVEARNLAPQRCARSGRQPQRRHRPFRGHGPLRGMAAHGGEFRPQGNGLPGRPQARRKAAAHRAALRLCRAARRHGGGARSLDGILAAVLSVAAVVTMVPGMLVERWLFFAEAKHTASVYYGR